MTATALNWLVVAGAFSSPARLDGGGAMAAALVAREEVDGTVVRTTNLVQAGVANLVRRVHVFCRYVKMVVLGASRSLQVLFLVRGELSMVYVYLAHGRVGAVAMVVCEGCENGCCIWMSATVTGRWWLRKSSARWWSKNKLPWWLTKMASLDARYRCSGGVSGVNEEVRWC